MGEDLGEDFDRVVEESMAEEGAGREGIEGAAGEDLGDDL